MKVSKKIIALFLSFAIFASSTLTVFAAGNIPDTGNVLYDIWDELTYSYFDQYGLGGIYQSYIEWCDSRSNNSTPKYGIGGGVGRQDIVSSGAKNETVYNSNSTKTYQAINPSNGTYYNPVTNTTSKYNNITYNNQIYTDNYNYTYDYTTNNTYNTYNQYDTYYIEGDDYYTYVTNNYTYLSYYIIDAKDPESTWYYEIYYQLPDGRNSWNMKADEVWGLALSYDATNYDVVVEDDRTVGLWHFDGNLLDSSPTGHTVGFISTPSSTFVDAPFASALYLDSRIDSTLFIPGRQAPDSFTLEGRIKYNGSPSDFGASETISNTGFLTGSRSVPLPEGFTAIGEIPTYSIGMVPSDPSPRTGSGSFAVEDKVVGYLIMDSWASFALPVTAKFAGSYQYQVVKTGKVSQNGNLETSYTATTTISCTGLYIYGIPTDTWFSFAVTHKPNQNCHFINGKLVYSEPITTEHTDFQIRATELGDVYIDELRLSNTVLYRGGYTPSVQPFDTNKVFVLPESGSDHQIAVKSSVPVSGMRVGGVRPTYPEDGYTYVYLENGIVLDVQQYQKDGWYSIDAALWKNGEWVNLKGQDLTEITISKPDNVVVDPGGSSPDGSDDTGNKFNGVLDSVLSGILSLLGDLLGLLLKIVFGLLGWVTKFLGFINTDYLGGFFPAPVWGLVCLIIPLIVVLGLIRFIRGFL